MKNRTLLLIGPALVVLILDQITKIMILGKLRVGESIPIVDGFFNLTHVRNRGVAFGILNRPGSDLIFYFSVAATIAAICLLILWFTKLKEHEFKPVFAFSLIIGGALGNLVDRLRIKEVVDFIDLYIDTYHWPAFNVADSAITIGIFWVAISIIIKRPAVRL